MSIFDHVKKTPVTAGAQEDLFAAQSESDTEVLESPDEVQSDELAGNSDVDNAEPENDDIETREAVALGDPPPPPPPAILSGDGFGTDDDGETAQIALYAERSYLAYAMSMVLGRALPYVHDGQKPVQRRILYAMHLLGLTHTTKHVKSARVVGDVIGKFHPHGDTSAYDAAVRLSQDFKMRYPLIDGQGNFGSRDGDNPAAMRYTEMRLTKICEVLTSELNEGTVDFVPNYDGAFQEPSLMPSRLPMMLMNGAEGIAVGMSATIPPHNLIEVTEASILAIQGKANIDTVMEVIKGPDFPGGGQIITSREDIIKAYATGRGTIHVRCKWEVEQMARGQYRIIITELPHDVSSNDIMSEIDELSSPTPKKDKKSLDQEQINMKQTLLSMVDLIRNESDSALRIIIEPKTSKIDPNDLMSFLMANTRLEDSYSINLTMVGIDGDPKRKNIVDIVQEWADYRVITVTRRTQFNFDKTMARIHILEGRMIAFLSIERIIQVIREADDPKDSLMTEFSLSELQAEDILEIKLRQLARLEGIKIENELNKLKEEADALGSLLANDGLMRKQIIKEIREDMKKFGDERRTLIEPAERSRRSAVALIQDEPVTIILSKQGWIRSRLGHGLDLTGVNYKPADSLLVSIETSSTSPVIILDNAGRSYSVMAHQIPGGKGEGVPLTTLVDFQKDDRDGGNKTAKFSHMISGKLEDQFVFMGELGYGFIAPLSGLIARNKAGKSFMTLMPNENILPPVAVAGNTYVSVYSDQGKLLIFPMSEVKVLANGGKGVMLIDVPEGAKANRIALLKEPLAVEVPGKRGKVSTLTGDELGKYIGRRARKGALLN